jgi:hypothetical protein
MIDTTDHPVSELSTGTVLVLVYGDCAELWESVDQLGTPNDRTAAIEYVTSHGYRHPVGPVIIDGELLMWTCEAP